jgi:hypothetical protein
MARRGTIVMLVLGAACLLAAAVGAYARYAILDEQAFADRAVSVLDSGEVQSEAARRLADRAVSEHPELESRRATIEDAAATAVVRDDAFAPAFRAAAIRMQRAIFSDADAPAQLIVPGSGAALRADVTQRLAVSGRRAPPFADPELLAVRGSGFEGALRALAPPARALAVPLSAGLGVLALAFLVTGVARARDRRRALAGAALAVAAAGGVTAAGVIAGHEVLVSQFTSAFGDAVVTAIWDAFLADLRRWALVAAAAALVVAAAVGLRRPSITRVPAASLGR